MNSSKLVFVIKILAFYLIGITTLNAQMIVDEVPDEYEENVENWVTDAEKSGSPFYHQRFTEVPYAEDIKNGRLFKVASDMVSRFDSLDWGDNENVQLNILNQLQFFLDALHIALNADGIAGVPDLKSEQNIFLETLNQQNVGLNSMRIETVFDSNGNEVMGFFAETTDEVVLYEYVEQGEEEKINLLVTPAQVREWRLLRNALTNLIFDQIEQIAEANIHSLRTAVVRWENFLDKGYSQMPWESLINGWLIDLPSPPDLGPPDHQWLIFHPTLGIGLQVDPLDEARAKEVMHIELLGHIWYRGKQLEDFSGFSVAASLREDLDAGLGLMLHLKRNWSFGITWHDVDEDPFLFFSVDLFRFAKQNAEKYESKYNEVKARLKGE